MPTEPEFLRVDALALPALHHGFTTRRGGVSEGPFASLNFSPKWPEEKLAVEENLARLAHAAGFDPARLYTAKQVHRKDGLFIDSGIAVAEARQMEADFLVTDRPGVTVAVLTADCVGILLADPEVPAVGAVHGGWRSLVAGIVERAVGEMEAFLGADRGRLVAALGPSIGPCCFEVGPEVAEQFENLGASGGPLVLAPEAGQRAKQHVDLWAAARHLLGQAGVAADRVSDAPACTKCEEERFHSYRRDGARVGQHLSFIGIREQ